MSFCVRWRHSRVAFAGRRACPIDTACACSSDGLGFAGSFVARKSWWRAIRTVVDEMAARDYRGAKALLDSLTRMRARPYDLRHSYLTDSYLAGKDFRATQAAAQHADSRMTTRYTLAAVDPRLTDVMHQLAARRAQAVPLPAGLPAEPAGTAAKIAKTGENVQVVSRRRSG